jgi:type II restriction/modification system DNA methylase subunit YeeA
MHPEEFVVKWRNVQFGEKQASQEMFLDICALADHPTPVAFGNPEAFTFEKRVPGGFADAYYEEHFGWEFKTLESELDYGLNQLLRYQVHLKTPPLLVVSSFRTIRIQTNFPGMETVRHEIPVTALHLPENLEMLRRVFHSPSDLRPNRTVARVTGETARLFHKIVGEMEELDADPEALARYLNQIVFCLYAEDAGLLRNELFSQIVREQNRNPATFDDAIRDLFRQMTGGGRFGAFSVAHFNGDLFNAADTVPLSGNALLLLEDAMKQNWRNIEPSIFGTLFERALDASKRSQLGAHYTSAADIELVVEPVVMAPLRREWEAAEGEVNRLISGGDDAAARERLAAFQRRLASVTVLDPACGSGNFLYIALRSLLDLEKQVIDFNDAQGWDEMYPLVRPDRMLGLEINPYAAELARTALWIGYIQWHQANGIRYRQIPILTPMNNSIRRTDAILADGDTANPRETEWPDAEFIIGNPPFLGHFPFREQLGDEYVDAVYSLYGGRIPNASDLCCYWFEKARAQIAEGKSRRAGLLATQAIRFQSNRPVLNRIKNTGDIFAAISDQNWVLDGAAVHISIVCFDDGSETARALDHSPVANINADLTSGADITQAKRITANRNLAFQGIGKVGDFDIPEEVALGMMAQSNPHGLPNSDVIKRWINGTDITQHPRNVWVIDFGVDMTEADAALYEAPFEYVLTNVKPERIKNRMRRRAERWWIHGSAAPNMRQALSGLPRYIGTSMVSRHRMFSYVDGDVLPDATIIVFARDDDYSFGVLHSRIHEVWARAMGTQLREAESGIRYTPTTCFETFPFPEPDEEQREAIAIAAARLNELREGWLNPLDANGNPALKPDGLRKRTLTNLYNRRPAWLANAHATLDAAVAAAYGWPAALPDAEILERLLALNLERSG